MKPLLHTDSPPLLLLAGCDANSPSSLSLLRSSQLHTALRSVVTEWHPSGIALNTQREQAQLPALQLRQKN